MLQSERIAHPSTTGDCCAAGFQSGLCRLWVQSRRRSGGALGEPCPEWPDCVAKLFCPSERARSIQDQASMRNVDSRIHSPRFDRCVFLFYSFSAVTFATQSPKSRHGLRCLRELGDGGPIGPYSRPAGGHSWAAPAWVTFASTPRSEPGSGLSVKFNALTC